MKAFTTPPHHHPAGSKRAARALTACVLALVAGSSMACSTEPVATSYRRSASPAPATASKPAPTTANADRSRVDPFWIEKNAENDRSVWHTGHAVTPASTAFQPNPTPPSTNFSTGSNTTRLPDGRTVGSHVYVHPETTGGRPRSSTSTTFNPPIDSFGSAPGVGQRTETDVNGLTDGLEGLTHVTFATEGADFDPVVSRDGKTLVFASTRHRETADLYSKSTTGSAVRQLTADPAQDVMPAISPDGSRIAFCSDRAGSWDIFVMSASGGQAVQLTTASAHEVHPSWSSDGSRLVFSRLGEVSRRWELWVMDVNSPTTAEFVGYGLFPEFCPVKGEHGAADKIVFQRSRERGDRAFSVWTIDYTPGDVGSPTEIATSREDALVNPTWSPDGRWIVFSSVKNPASTGNTGTSDLWMTSLDGSAKVNLTAGRFENLMPTWSPDGKVYFVSNREGVSSIWAVGTEKAVAAATGVAPYSGRHTEQAAGHAEEAGHGTHGEEPEHGVATVPTESGGHE